MFDKQYRFTGTHAKMVKELTSGFDESGKLRLFKRNLDVYINAPIIGFINKRKGQKNTDNDIADVSILGDQLIGESSNLEYVFRLILLLDEEYEPDKTKRLDKAFRYFGKGESENDLKLFDEYVLGGVEVFHEKLIQTSSGTFDYIAHLYDFIADFSELTNRNIASKDIVSLCVNGKQV